MYLSLLFLPLVSATVPGFLGRKIGFTGTHLITTSLLGFSAVLSMVAFYEVCLMGSPVYLYLGTWFDSELLLVS